MSTTIHISLTEPLKDYVDAQMEAGNFETPSEYIRELIVEDHARRRKSLEQHLLDSLQEEAGAIEVPGDVLESGDIVGFLEERANRFK